MGNTGKTDTRTVSVVKPQSTNKIIIKKCKLFVVSGPLQGQEFIVNKDIFSIGADPNNDLPIQDNTISRRHCELQHSSDGYVIRDLGSTNGTIVQGMKVTEAIMSQSTEFQLGQTKIVFCPLREATEYEISPHEALGSLLGKSTAMRRIFYQVERYAPTDATILIEGETGTGKEILAEEIHKHSKRADKPFVVIDCASLAKEVIESELFGHKKGSFTGANIDRIGAFEHASGGTVFLDEIGEVSPDLQPKLLRVLEKKEIKRVGSNEVKQIDVRIITATNRRLESEVNAGRFREDLYYRLSVVHVELPPLRRRKEDIPMLVRKFLTDFNREDLSGNGPEFDKILEALSNHNWPGNVRELRNLVEIASYSARTTADLSAYIYLASVKTNDETVGPAYTADRPFKEMKNHVVGKFEKQYVASLMNKHEGNISAASRDADIERTYLRKLIKKHDLNDKP